MIRIKIHVKNYKMLRFYAPSNPSYLIIKHHAQVCLQLFGPKKILIPFVLGDVETNFNIKRKFELNKFVEQKTKDSGVLSLFCPFILFMFPGHPAISQ